MVKGLSILIAGTHSMVVPAINVEWSIVAERIFAPDSQFWRALATTVSIAVVAQVLGILLGLLSALAG